MEQVPKTATKCGAVNSSLQPRRQLMSVEKNAVQPGSVRNVSSVGISPMRQIGTQEQKAVLDT